MDFYKIQNIEIKLVIEGLTKYYKLYIDGDEIDLMALQEDSFGKPYKVSIAFHDAIGKIFNFDNHNVEESLEFINKYLVDCKIDKPFIPKEGEKFYYIGAGGETEYILNGDEYEEGIILNQPVFRTREEAEKQAEQNKAGVKLRNRIAEINNSVKEDNEKYNLAYDSTTGVVIVSKVLVYQYESDGYTLRRKLSSEEFKELYPLWKTWKGIEEQLYENKFNIF